MDFQLFITEKDLKIERCVTVYLTKKDKKKGWRRMDLIPSLCWRERGEAVAEYLILCDLTNLALPIPQL